MTQVRLDAMPVVAVDSQWIPRRILVIAHAVMIGDDDTFGPAHNVVEHLVENGYDVEFVLHPLARGQGSTRVKRFTDGRLVDVRQASWRRLTRVREGLHSARRIAGGAFDALIVVDPLNYASAFVARRFSRTARITVYMTADYADRRFANPIVNAVYHALDRTAIRDAGAVWNVSRRITELRDAQGVVPARNFFVPNAPRFDASRVLPIEDRQTDSLVCAGTIDDYLDIDMLVGALAIVKASRPHVRVTWIGDGPRSESLRARALADGVLENLHLVGYLPHDTALEIMGRSRIGLALYSGSAVWNEYGDSLKTREYLALGLPIVTTRTHALVDELERRGAGIVVDSAEHAADAIERLLGRDGPEAHRACIELASENSRDVVLTSALTALEHFGQVRS